MPIEQDERPSIRQNHTRRLKVIAIFLHEYAYGKALGGVERRFIEISKHMQSFGVQLYAVEYAPALSRFLQCGYRSLIVSRHKPKSAMRLATELIRLSLLSVKFSRRSGCEIVYSPSSVFYQVIPALFVSVCLRKPLVVVFHSLPYTNLKSSFASLLRSSLTSGESLRTALVKSSIERLRRTAYTHASMCIAVSNSTAEQVYQSFKPRSLVVSSNGVSEDWFNSEDAPKTYDACFLGRISPRKRIDLLLRAWKQVLSNYPTAKLVIVGGGEDLNYVESCQRIIQTLDMENNVTMTGFLDDNSVRRTLRSSKIFVLPSAREGFGLAIVEAMASGLACVLPSLPSLKENFQNFAVFVDCSDPEAWSGAICRILADQDLQSKLSDSGRKLASHFRWEAVADKEAKVFLELIHGEK